MAVWAVTAAVAAGYVGTSYILFKKPTLLHKKKPFKFRCTHISHRGGAAENLENTMTAFRHAVYNCDTDMIELDCQLTKDGQVVVAHDPNLGRIAGVDKLISDFNYEDLPKVSASQRLDFNGGTLLLLDFKNELIPPDFHDRRIPRLREVFEEFPNLPVNVDVKQHNPELMSKICDLIKEYKRESFTPWGNFRDSVCKMCYEYNRNIPVIFSLRRAFLLVLYFYTGLLPFIPIKESCLELLMPAVIIDNPHIRLHRPGIEMRTLFRLFDKLLMKKSLFDHLRKRGIHVYCWVLNSESEYERAFRLGVDGVMTDFPSKLRDFLNEHPEYAQRTLRPDIVRE